MDNKQHWETVYQTKLADQVSWYRPHLETSLAWIGQAVGRDAAVIDVGGGESTLVDDLLDAGYRSLSVLDISQAAIDATRARLGDRAAKVDWVVGDITQVALPARRFDVWHDRAVFHFLTDPVQRAAYVDRLLAALKPGGQAIIATFGPDGPQQCSGLAVVRYDVDALLATLGARFTLRQHTLDQHRTPWGSTQQFLYGRFRVEPSTHA